MLPRTAALLTGFALAVSGCAGGGGGGGDFEGEAQQVAEAIDELRSTATRQENAGQVCRELLSRALAARLSSGGTRCEQEIGHAISDADLFDVQVLDVAVEGTNARARVESTVGDQTTAASLTLIQEQGDWRLDGIRPVDG